MEMTKDKTVNLPSRDIVRADVDPLLPVLRQLLDAAAGKAREYPQENLQRRDLCFMSHLVRLHVKSGLVGLSFDCRDIPNTGIFFTYGKYPIRILKADEGELPVPGQSRKRQDFYGQAHSLELFPRETQQQTDGPNLIYLWDINADYFVDSLKLICPKAGGGTRGSVETHWEDILVSPKQWAREQGERGLNEIQALEQKEAAASVEDQLEDDLDEIRPLPSKAARVDEGEDD